MTNEILIEGKRFVGSKEAGALFGLSSDYISRLCREEKVPGRLIGHTWYVEADKLTSYIAKRESEKKIQAQELRDQRIKEYQGNRASSAPAAPISTYVAFSASVPVVHDLNNLFPATPVVGTPVAKKVRAMQQPAVVSPIMVFPAVILTSLLFSVTAFAMINPGTFKGIANSISTNAHHLFADVGSVVSAVRGGNGSSKNLAAASVAEASAATSTVLSDTASAALSSVQINDSAKLVIGNTLVSRPDFTSGVMEVGVPLSIKKTLSVDGAATFSDQLTAAGISAGAVRTTSLAVAGTARLAGSVFVAGPSVFDGSIAANGGITTSGADIDLQGGRIFASNVVNGIKAGSSNVTITGTASNPIISVTIPPASFGGGGGGGNGSVTSVSGTGGLTGSVTSSGSLSIDFSSANTWNALQVFAAGASSSSLTLDTALGIASGGTGTSTAPTYGQFLIGDGNGGYMFSPNFTIGLNGATTTNFAITSATSSLLRTDANGFVFAAVAGSDYLDATSLNTSAKLAAYLTDETGTPGSVVFSASPTFSGTANFVATHNTAELIVDSASTFTGGFAAGADSTVTGGFKVSGTATSSDLAIINVPGTILKTNALGQVVPAIPGVDYATGAVSSSDQNWMMRYGALTPTTTLGVLVSASSTFGNGTQNGGLTIYGGATTTGSSYIGGSLTLGTALAVISGGTGANNALNARQNLGLGSIATQAATSVAITGGSIYGVAATTTSLAITNATSSLLKTDAFGNVIPAVSGTDYVTGPLLLNFLALTDWYATTTDALHEGTNNLYFTNLRARNALSSAAAGLSYSTSTGAISLTAGYTIPLTASTTEWTSAYQNRISSVSGPLSFVNNNLAIDQASGSQGGYLSAGDWTTFNNKLSLNSLSATAPVLYNSTTGTFSIQQANGTQGGYLSAADWTTFGNKQDVLAFTYPLSVTGTTVSTAFSTTTNNTFAGTNTFNGATTLANATSTSFAITNLTNAILKANANGSVVAATPGTDYVAPSTLTSYLSLANWYATTTDALREGTANQYFTPARVRASLFAAGPLNFNSTTGTYSISQASSTNDGYLSSTDWTTFNNKLGANSISGTGVISYNSGTGVITTTGGTFGAGNYTFPAAVAGQSLSVAGTATTSGLAITGVAGTILKTNALGQVVPAVAGVDYVNSGALANNSTWSIVGGALAPTTTIGTIVSASSTFTSTLNANSLNLTNALAVGSGGTGVNSLTGLVKGNGASAFTAAVAGTDFQAPITASYPILFSGNNLSLAFGTTTANTWSQIQTFTSGFAVYASSTIGNGTQAGGLTVSGGATTTGKAIVQGAFAVTGATVLSNTLNTSGLSTLSGGFVSQASSSVIGGLTTVGTATSTNLAITGVTGTLLKTNALGQVVAAAASTDYAPVTTGSSILYGNGSGGFSSVSVSGPLSFSTGTLSINNAAADAATKGAATFATNDFNDNGSGVISIDYTAGQLATGAQNGFLSSSNWTTFNNKVSSTSLSATGPLSYNSATGVFTISQATTGTAGYLSFADFNTFNNKQSALSFAYPLVNTSGTISSAFGTTTNNTFSGANIFNGSTTLANATTTSFAITGTPSTLLKTDAAGNVVAAVPGTDYALGGSGVTSFNGRTGVVVPTGSDYTTSLVAEGSNLYFTTNRVAGVIAGTTTTALAEGSNLYFTNNRVASVIAGTTTDALAQGTVNKYYSTNLFAADLAGTTTSALREGSNQYFTNARVEAVINASTTIPKTTLANVWLPLQTFGSGFISQASSTVVGVFTASSFTGAGTGLTGTAASLSIGGNAGTATALQNARTINGTSFDGTSNIVITAASSTHLVDNNTFSGVNSFLGNTTLANATSTNFFATTASSTNLFAQAAAVGSLKLGGITNSYLATDAAGNVVATTSLSAAEIAGILGINQGGTATGTQVTNGVNYFDGTRITSGTALTFNGTLFKAPSLFATGSSTIGDGTQTGGLTVNGGATTTGNAYIGGTANLSSSGAVGFNGDIFVSRNGAGILQIGTTASNASGNLVVNGFTSQGNTQVNSNLLVGGASGAVLSGNSGNLGVGTTSPFAKLSVAGSAYIGGNLTATGTLAVAGQTTLSTASSTALTSTNLFSTLASSTNLTVSSIASGNLVKTTTGGSFIAAVSGTDYAPATSGSSILYGNGAGGFSSVSVTGPLSFST
ncbi:MAG: hypothetical protein JWM46_270, partial [Candidatus Kaiserbacteria bacterium]|nr:hypothetical protein [Candidatus Kaiserbacteria bacterium]